MDEGAMMIFNEIHEMNKKIDGMMSVKTRFSNLKLKECAFILFNEEHDVLRINGHGYIKNISFDHGLNRFIRLRIIIDDKEILNEWREHNSIITESINGSRFVLSDLEFLHSFVIKLKKEVPSKYQIGYSLEGMIRVLYSIK